MTAKDTFPVESFKDAAPYLRRPFTAAAVKFKPQSVTKTGKTLCVAYIDARLVIERLNLVCPHLWHDVYEPTAKGAMWCHLTVDNITRSDVGEGQGKGLVSDALKRAAVHFGIGVPLYAVPQQFMDGEIKFLNDQHQRQLRAKYATWLAQHGKKAFGEPLDHGDVEDAQGDHEADPTSSPGGSSSSAPGVGAQRGGTPAARPETSDEDPWVTAVTASLTDLDLLKELRPKLKDAGVIPPSAAGLKTVLSRLEPSVRTVIDEWLGVERLKTLGAEETSA